MTIAQQAQKEILLSLYRINPSLHIYKRFGYNYSLFRNIITDTTKCVFVCAGTSNERAIYQACNVHLHGLSSLGNMT